MRLPEAPPPGLEALAGADIALHGHLPVAAAYCRRLGLAELVDKMVPTRMRLRPGAAVQAMVLDTLSGRSPLYHVEEFLEGADIELLVGEAIPAHAFNDTNLARSMDAIFEAGPSRILAELGIRAAREFRLDGRTTSYDTTSTSVWGDYAACSRDDPPPGPRVVHGHSKDRRPDLKQFMTELLCVERGVPIFGRTLDGNSSDKASNNAMLSRVGAVMARHGLGPGAFVHVADSAMVTKPNLEAAGPNRFVTRLPANYSECSRAITEAVGAGAWKELGTLAETPAGPGRPNASYKASEARVVLYGKEYRALVVHSSAHDKRRRKKLDKALAASAKALEAGLRALPREFSCEADARAAAERAGRLAGALHAVEASVVATEVRKRGRPPKDAPPATRTRYSLAWRISENREAVERERELAGCFVLLTNVPAEGDGSLDARALLRTYKGQYGVENDFAFLKDPLIVNDLFLKKPQRIDVLGMVLVVALMVWRLMERSLRAHVANTGGTLPGWDRKRTTRPTAYMATWILARIAVATVGGGRTLLRPPSEAQSEVLAALGVGPPAFLDPRYRCEPVVPAKD
jgi:transposase